MRLRVVLDPRRNCLQSVTFDEFDFTEMLLGSVGIEYLDGVHENMEIRIVSEVRFTNVAIDSCHRAEALERVESKYLAVQGEGFRDRTQKTQ